MAARSRSNDVSPRPRRSKAVWPVIFGVLLLITLLVVLAFTLGWIDTGGELPRG